MKLLITLVFVLGLITGIQHHDLFKERTWYCFKDIQAGTLHGIAWQDPGFQFCYDFRKNGAITGNHFRKLDKSHSLVYNGIWTYDPNQQTLTLTSSSPNAPAVEIFKVKPGLDESYLVLSKDGDRFYFVSSDE